MAHFTCLRYIPSNLVLWPIYTWPRPYRSPPACSSLCSCCSVVWSRIQGQHRPPTAPPSVQHHVATPHRSVCWTFARPVTRQLWYTTSSQTTISMYYHDGNVETVWRAKRHLSLRRTVWVQTAGHINAGCLATGLKFWVLWQHIIVLQAIKIGVHVHHEASVMWRILR